MAFIDWRELDDRFGAGRVESLFGSSLEPWPDAPPGGWEVELVWADIDGRYECVGLALLGDGSESLTASKLRKLPLGSLIVESRRRKLIREQNISSPDAARRYAEAKGVEYNEEVEDSYDLFVRTVSQRHIKALTTPRRRYPPEHYERVAEIYDEAMEAGIPPTAHVQQELGLRTRTQAAKQVARARKRGLLPPTEQRVPKGNTE